MVFSPPEYVEGIKSRKQSNARELGRNDSGGNDDDDDDDDDGNTVEGGKTGDLTTQPSMDPGGWCSSQVMFQVAFPLQLLDCVIFASIH